MSSHSEEPETQDVPTENETYTDESEIEEVADIEEDDYEMSEHESDIPEIFDEPLQIDELLTSVLATPDGDPWPDEIDLCRFIPDVSGQTDDPSAQADADGDGVGDACDLDDGTEAADDDTQGLQLQGGCTAAPGIPRGWSGLALLLVGLCAGSMRRRRLEAGPGSGR